ncbi:MAG: helix-turn-helix domain-containing protein [Bacteroidetes bacterium]|nr:helix-turn-helix domain-containing protein [Bacteroidota bacterium]
MKYVNICKCFALILILSQSLFMSGQGVQLIKDVDFKNILHQKTKEYTKKVSRFGLEKEFDSAMYYSQKAILISNESKNLELINYANINKAKLLYWQDNIEDAKLLLDKSLKSQKVNDSIKLYAHYVYGEIKDYEKEYVESIEHYIHVEKIMDKKLNLTKRDSNKIAINFFRIGDIHFKLENSDNAKVNYEKSLVYAKNENLKSDILYQISTLYEEVENLPQAIKYAKSATDIASKNKWQLMLPTYYAGLSEYYLKYKKPDSAIYYANIGLKDNSYCRLNWLNASIGNGYYMKKDYPKAIEYFKTALQYTTPSETLEVYENLREIYTQTGKYKLALKQNDLYLVLKDSLDNLKVKQEIVDITEKYESDKKQSKIKLLSDENEINSIVIKKQKKQIISYASSFFLLLTVLGLILFFYVQKKRQKYLLYLNNRQLLFIQEEKQKQKQKVNNTLTVKEVLKKEEICINITNLINAEFYLDNEVTLLKMSKMANTNSSYLSKIINEDYYKSFANFINEHRISYTLKKLELIPEYRKLTIDHIAENAGFSSSNAFYRAFKKNTGLTPAYYIKKRLEDD